MSTFHERGARVYLEKILSAPEGPTIITETRDALRDGTWFERSYVDMIGQTARRSATWKPEQIATFREIHTGMMTGKYGSVRIEVGAGPEADVERERNSAALSDVAEPFVANLDMTQRRADYDGRLSWPEEIRVPRSTGAGLLPICPNDRQTPVEILSTLGPGDVPLEVGYTLPSRTYLHLYQYGGVARWPYESSDIHLLVNFDHARWHADRTVLRVGDLGFIACTCGEC